MNNDKRVTTTASVTARIQKLAPNSQSITNRTGGPSFAGFNPAPFNGGAYDSDPDDRDEEEVVVTEEKKHARLFSA